MWDKNIYRTPYFKKIFAISIVIIVGIVLVFLILRMQKATVSESEEAKEKADLHREETELTKESQGEGRVELTPEAVQSAGIVIETAGSVQIKTILELPGEIMLNADKLVHVVPRVSGVVTGVYKNLGDTVNQGEILAVLESRELAELKSLYLASVKRVELARLTFERKERLWKQKISSEKDYLASRQALTEEEINLHTAT